MSRPRLKTAVAGSLLMVLAVAPGALASPPGDAGGGSRDAAAVVPELPLGPRSLTQTTTTSQLRPGVTWTRIVRGAVDPSVPWVLQLSIPAGGSDPDPDAPAKVIQDRATADALVTRLDAAGFPAEAQPVSRPATVDLPGGVIGYRVRLSEAFPTKDAATARNAELAAAGFTASTWYVGWDGGSRQSSRWSVEVLTIDPRRFRGTLDATYGPDLEQRETVTQLADLTGARAAINAGFFVLDPAAGAPGDPAGAGVYDGRFVSEAVGRRPVMVLNTNASRNRVERPHWAGRAVLQARGGKRTTVPLDGINRVPGLVRNCGGDSTDAPTALPLHDVTCTDGSELVLFDTTYGASTPTGEGSEIVLDRNGRVAATYPTRGHALAAGQRSLQATGGLAATTQYVAVGDQVGVTTKLVARGRSLVRPGTTVVNGGPELLRNGRVHVTLAADGMHHPGDPSFEYGWALQRNPRTFGGIDAAGRTVLVVVDGRQLGESGLSISETADVAKALGLRDALNFDGGGSSAMVVDGQLVSDPSDATGERPVGDAIVIR